MSTKPDTKAATPADEDDDDPASWPLVTMAAQMAPAGEPEIVERAVREIRQRFLFKKLTAGEVFNLRRIDNVEDRETLLLTKCLVGPNGQPLWPDHKKGVEKLHTYPTTVQSVLYYHAQKLNSAVFEDDEAKAVADAEGNSETTPSDSDS